MEITLHDDHFLLLPERAIFWREGSALILSDAHFGKTAHFRKEGIPIPDNSFNADMRTLDELVKKHKPESLIVVGDMFHSSHNKEIEIFADWRRKHKTLEILLIKGNHDILAAAKYDELQIQTSKTYTSEAFIFSHESCNNSGLFCFSGHIHPGVRITGIAKQQLKFPCFHFTKHVCTLPAFSKFTGLSIIDCSKEDKVYAIVGNDIMPC